MTASVEFLLGGESVTVPLQINLDTETIITGDFGGLIPAGTTARLRGNVNMTGNIHVRGTLLTDPTGVDVNGNGFDIHTHDGTLNLVGTEKTAWLRWGDTPVGWQTGDRLAVAPTKAGIYVPSEMTWTGSWATMTRPVNSPDVPLVNGSVAKPEVVNLAQSVTFRNLQRIMIHEASGPNPQTFKWIRVLNSGQTNVLGMYPIHFHMIGDYARGSTLEGVVVEGGKNRAYVPHASHGITYTGCVAYKTAGSAYWWDLPPDQLPGENDPSPINDSEDIVWDRCLSMVSTPSMVDSPRLGGFALGAGLNLACIDSVATCVHGNPNASESNRQRAGFVWPEGSTRSSWLFQRCVGHNNVDSGLLVWQNARRIVNLLEDFTAYHNGFEGINHGSYINRYHYARANLTGNGFRQHAKSPDEGPMVVEDILSDRRLYVTLHNSGVMEPSFYRRCTFPSVEYHEPSNGSWNVFEDCGLTPAMFNTSAAAGSSIIEIKEAGVLMHRWQSGVWS